MEENLRGKKVVIIEDDTLLHSLLADKMAELRKSGVEVFPALNGNEGLAAVRSSRPDLILLDLVMPDKNGFDVLEELRRDDHLKDVQVIILSNLNQESDRVRAKELGVKKFFVKADFSLDEILKEVIDILNGSQ